MPVPALNAETPQTAVAAKVMDVAGPPTPALAQEPPAPAPAPAAVPARESTPAPIAITASPSSATEVPTKDEAPPAEATFHDGAASSPKSRPPAEAKASTPPVEALADEPSVRVPEEVAVAIPTVAVAPPSTPDLPGAVEPASSPARMEAAEARPAPEVVPSALAPAMLDSSTVPDEDVPFRPRRRVGVYVALGSAVAAAGVWFALQSSPARRPHTPHATASQGAASAATTLPAPTAPATAAPAEIPAAREAMGATSADVPKAAENPDAAGVPQVATTTDAGVAASSEGPKDTSADSSAITAALDAGATDTDADTVTVAFNVWPTGAFIAYKGREIGRSPFKMQIKRGEKRAVEVVFPGYMPRRVVVDGSQPEISFGMKPAEPTTPAAPAAPAPATHEEP